MTQPRKFVFDTVFEPDGAVFQPPRPKRTYTAEEVDAIRAEAFAEGQASSIAQAEAVAAAALQEVTHLTRGALHALAEIAHHHRTASAELALACARKIADAALDVAPEAPAVAALQALARELEAAPRLIVHASPRDEQRLAGALEEAAVRAGFPGAIQLRPAAGAHAAAFTLDWGEGRASFDPEASAERIAAALAAALAVEGLHAEVVVPPASDPEGAQL